MPLSRLSEADLANAFHGAHRRILEELEQPDCSYASLAAKIGITDSALKQFVRRGRLRDDSSQVRRGAAFEKIVRYLRARDSLAIEGEPKDLTGEDARIIDTLSSLTERQKVLVSYWAVSEILGVNEADIDRSGRKMAGYYYCYRSGSSPEYLVKSLLRIAPVDGIPNSCLYEFFHSHYDSNGVLKESDGLFTSIAKCNYLFGDLAKGEGIDFLLMKEPLSEKFDFIPAFQVSVDHNHQPFFAKLLCFRLTNEVSGQSVDDETSLRENTGIIRKDVVAATGIDGDKLLGRRLLDHFLADPLTRIEMSDIVTRLLERP